MRYVNAAKNVYHVKQVDNLRWRVPMGMIVYDG